MLCKSSYRFHANNKFLSVVDDSIPKPAHSAQKIRSSSQHSIDKSTLNPLIFYRVIIKVLSAEKRLINVSNEPI
jgi:hypothetical protein